MQSFPEIYPQMLALPITHQPLFPGFYLRCAEHYRHRRHKGNDRARAGLS